MTQQSTHSCSIPGLHHLENLSLGANMFSPRGVHEINHRLPQPSRLTALDLSGIAKFTWDTDQREGYQEGTAVSWVVSTLALLPALAHVSFRGCCMFDGSAHLSYSVARMLTSQHLQRAWQSSLILFIWT
jgi:hypothetical protein